MRRSYTLVTNPQTLTMTVQLSGDKVDDSEDYWTKGLIDEGID